MKVVLDTNVLISGAFFTGPPFYILRSCIQGDFQLVLSPEIIVEYRRVGEEFSRRRSNPEFEKLLSLLVAQALIVDAPALENPICRDPCDDKFIACALVVDADVIISGDKDLLSISGESTIRIMRPKEFVDRYIK